MLNLFDVANPNLFSIFSREETKRFYADLLNTIYRDFQQSKPQDMDRTRIQRLIQYVLDDYPELVDGDKKETAAKIYKKLLATGWLSQEQDDMDRYLVRRTKAAIPFLQAIGEITTDRTVSLGGYLQSVEAQLRNIESDPHPYNNCFLFAFDTMREFLDAVDQLLATLKLEAEDISKTEDLDEMMKKLEAYLDRFNSSDDNAGMFYQLQFKENWTTTRKQAISALLFRIEDSEQLLDSIAEDLYRTDRGSFPCMDAAAEKVKSEIQDFHNMLAMIDEKDRDIANSQSRYQKNATRALSMLARTGKNASSRINAIVKALEREGAEDTEWYQQLQEKLSWVKPAFLNSTSLFTPRIRMDTGTVDVIPIDQPDFPDPIDAIIDANKSVLSQEKMDKLVETKMAGKPKLTHQDIPITSKADFTQMLLITAFSSSAESLFQTEFSEETVTIQTEDFKATFPKFTISRKGAATS